MNMDFPLVSIIIPVYNGANYLREAIESALSQTYPNIEILIINDGSCDNGATEEIALSYGDKIRYFRKENGGVATALNKGIEEMRGDYFSWLSHDDLYYPQKVERQINALRECGDMTRIVNSDFDFYDEDRHQRIPVLNSQRYPMEKLEDSIFIILEDSIHACTLLIHKSHFQRVGNFNEALRATQDMDLWFRMFRGQKLLYLPEVLTVYRLHSQRGTHNIPVYNHECDMRNVGYMQRITQEEIRRFYGTPHQFYLKMMQLAKGGNLMEAYRYAMKLFRQAEVPQEMSDELARFHEAIDRYFPEDVPPGLRKICIFCAGDFGRKLYWALRERLVAADFFCDNSPDKWGYMMDRVSCIPRSALAKYKDCGLIIVANHAPEEIVNDLKAEGYRTVITKQELDPILDTIPPVKWAVQWPGLESLDYSTPEAGVLIETFSQAVFDICSYYQRKYQELKQEDSRA